MNNKTITLSIIVILAIGIGIYAINTVDTGYQIAHTETKQIDAHGTCKDVTNNSGQSTFVSTKTSAEWTDFLNNLPTGVTTVDCPTCGGYSFGGYCYYFAADNQTCDAFCAANGGCNAAGISHTGATGSLANCQAVITGLGVTGPAAIDSALATGYGCIHLTDTGYGAQNYRDTTNPSTCATSAASYRRICACNN